MPKPKKNEPVDRDRRLPVGLARALSGRKKSTDSGELLSDLIDVWGGTRQLALDLHREYQKASEGGQTRQRILDMIQRLIITNTTNEIGQVEKPADMTDEDLASIALTYMKRLAPNGAPTSEP